MAVAVKAAAALGPVTVLSQFPQLVAMNARKTTGPANTSEVKIILLFTIRDSFFILENMVSLFFCGLMVDRISPYSGRLLLKPQRAGSMKLSDCK